MKQAYVKGTDIRIVGTLETCTARANILGFKGDSIKAPEYSGESELFWDEQRTVTRDGSIVYLDEDGEEHLADELELRDE